MSLFLDCASVGDARRAVDLGLIWGATTNSALMITEGHRPAQVLANLCELFPGTVFYQLTAPTLAERETEALSIVAIDPVKIGLSIPCTTENLGLLSRLTDEGITCGVTAVFSVQQVYLACQAGAHFVLPSVNRSTQLQGDGPKLVGEMRDIIEAVDTGTELLATDIKTSSEAVEAVLAGAHHLSLSLDLLLSLGEHPLSQQLIEEFNRGLD